MPDTPNDRPTLTICPICIGHLVCKACKGERMVLEETPSGGYQGRQCDACGFTGECWLCRGQGSVDHKLHKRWVEAGRPQDRPIGWS